MKSSSLTTVSGVSLGLSGSALLFVPDLILPKIIPDFPVTAAWLGQLMGAAWIGLGAMNWFSRRTVLGGIYGRPIIMANLAVYFVGGMSVFGAARKASYPTEMVALLLPAAVLAMAYIHLMLRGPWSGDRDKFGSG